MRSCWTNDVTHSLPCGKVSDNEGEREMKLVNQEGESPAESLFSERLGWCKLTQTLKIWQLKGTKINQK